MFSVLDLGMNVLRVSDQNVKAPRRDVVCKIKQFNTINMTTHMNKISDYLQQQNINNSLLVHSHWHAARYYQYNTTHKVDQTKIFFKSQLTCFSFSHSWFDGRKYHSMDRKRH